MNKAQRAAHLQRRILRLVELYASIMLRVGNDPTLNDKLVIARTALHETLEQLTHEAS